MSPPSLPERLSRSLLLGELGVHGRGTRRARAERSWPFASELPGTKVPPCVLRSCSPLHPACSHLCTLPSAPLSRSVSRAQCCLPVSGTFVLAGRPHVRAFSTRSPADLPVTSVTSLAASLRGGGKALTVPSAHGLYLSDCSTPLHPQPHRPWTSLSVPSRAEPPRLGS